MSDQTTTTPSGGSEPSSTVLSEGVTEGSPDLEIEGTEPGSDPRPTALVTGASRGIGAHLVRGLLDAGWSVVALTRGPHLPESLMGAVGSGLEHVRADVTDADAVHEAIEQAYARVGQIDLLVNNAGLVETEAPIWESDPEEWWGVLTTNVRGPYLVSRAVVPRMLAAGGGRVVNINSGAATRSSQDLSAYAASKTALARLTESLALAGADGGVLAFDLAPGVVSTDMTHSMVMHTDRTEWTDPQDVIALLLALASGALDAFSGRMVRAGADDLVVLYELAERGLEQDARTLRLTPYGPADPVA